jgi:cobalt-zinc-cadmium efflux system membrane fusion protein
MKYIYLLILSVVFYSCNDNKKQATELAETDTETHVHIDVTSAQFESENMELGYLKEQDFFETVTTTGYIDVPPQNKASVSSFMDGYVTNTPLLVGDEVKKGQLVVTLQNPEYIELQQNYLEVSETLNYLKSEYERQKTLFKENITSKKNYLKAESEYKSNLAHYNGLKQKLRMLNLNPKYIEQGKISSNISLFAPINGFVTKVNVSNGSYVDASSEIVEIVDTDHIHLELSVFEKDILNIKKGQLIKFKIPEASDETFDAEVYLVGTSINETNRTVEIHGHLNDEEKYKNTFVRGMFIEANIITSTHKLIALPKEAFAEIDGEYFALILNSSNESNYEFEMTKVEIGKQNEHFVELLNADDFKDKQVLIKGAYMLLANNEGGGHSH